MLVSHKKLYAPLLCPAPQQQERQNGSSFRCLEHGNIAPLSCPGDDFTHILPIIRLEQGNSFPSQVLKSYTDFWNAVDALGLSSRRQGYRNPVMMSSMRLRRSHVGEIFGTCPKRAKVRKAEMGKLRLRAEVRWVGRRARRPTLSCRSRKIEKAK